MKEFNTDLYPQEALMEEFLAFWHNILRGGNEIFLVKGYFYQKETTPLTYLRELEYQEQELVSL